MKLKVELLPCPFCGSDKVLLCQWRDTENPNATWIGCENCGISQDSFHHEDAEHVKGIATMMWNTRMPNPTQLTAERDKYRDAYNELIFAVSHKYESETRHQTALKYIQQAEESSGEACANPDNGADFARQVKAELEGE